jgi:hypothetical protein
MPAPRNPFSGPAPSSEHLHNQRAPGLRRTGSRRDTYYEALMAIPLNPMGASDNGYALAIRHIQVR